MADLIAVTFDEPSLAFDLRAELVRLQGEYLIQMEDAVVVTRSDAGKIQLHQATNLTAMGAVGGSFWGLLLGTLLLSPLLGAAVGAGVGALSGKLADIGINDDFMRRVGESLPAGGAAVFVLVKKATPDKVLARLHAFQGKGTVLQSSLTADQEDALRKALEEAPVS
jgi:uncharacterized membrane protein